MGERIGVPRSNRIHEGSLSGGNKMVISGNGNGKREICFLGKRREVDVSDKSEEVVGMVTDFLQREFGVNEELAKDFAREMCEMEK